MLDGGQGAVKCDKISAILCILSVQKNVIMNLKINSFNENNINNVQPNVLKLFAIFSSNINLYVQVSTKVNMFIFNKGVWR